MHSHYILHCTVQYHAINPRIPLCPESRFLYSTERRQLPDQDAMSLPREATSSSGPLAVPLSSSPGSHRGRDVSSSVPRATSIARLAASPIRSQVGSPPARQISSSSQVLASGSYTSSISPLAGPTSSSVPGPGISALAAALSASGTQSPPKFGTPPLRSVSPNSLAQQAPVSELHSNYGSFDARGRHVQGAPRLNGTNGYEDPEIVRRHLVQQSEASP